MQTQNNGGDSLARGASRAQFRPMGENVTKEKWDAMWEGFDPTTFAAQPNPAQEKHEGTETETTGVR
jgi:hypothetical protein